MPPFLPQAKPTTNPLLLGDSSAQITRLGDTIGKTLADVRERNALMEIGQAAAGGDLKAAQEAAFRLGKPGMALQVSNMLQQRSNRAEDVAFRNQQAERAQINADRSFGLQKEQLSQNTAIRRDQLKLQSLVQDQNFKLKMLEIDGKNKKLSNILTPGQQAADKKFADEYVQFSAAGGFADVDKQLTQLDGVLKDLESGKKNLTGPLRGLLPDTLNLMTPGGQEAVASKNRVEEVVQRNLRVILGAQFTEREGQRLIERAYNPQLGEKENASRLRSLIKQIRTMAKQKQAASDYFEKNGTIAGFKGIVPGIGEIGDVGQPQSAAPTQPAAAASPAPPAGFQIVE